MSAAVAALTLSIAYVFGRFWFDESDRRGPEVQPSASAMDNSTPSSRGKEHHSRPATTSTPILEALPPPALPGGGDRTLIEAWTRHREAMRSLYDIIYNEFLYRHGPLAACRKLVDKRRCSVRFHCAVHREQVELQLEQVYCGLQPGDDPSDAALQACVDRTLEIPGPLGLPAQTAAELAAYDGPIEVAWWAE